MLFLIPLSGFAQITLMSVSGATETPVGSSYSLGSVAAGSSTSVQFRAHNLGTTPVVITTLAVSGSGFSISAINGTVPFTVPPLPSSLAYLQFTVTFNGPTPANYSANLQVNNLSVILTASAITPPTLNILTGCAPTNNNGVDFGNVQIGSTRFCSFSLVNPTNSPMTISTISLNGGFFFQLPPVTPLVLGPLQGTMFAIEITPACGVQPMISGTLTINAQVYPLQAEALTQSLPTPVLTFDPPPFLSNQQHALTMTLPIPSICGATGNLNLAFAPMGTLPNDATVVFVARNSRSVQFTVPAGATKAVVDGGSSVVFATGSTAGALTFTVTGPTLAADPTTSIVIGPAIISIESATASNQRAGELDVTVTAFDNTYSAGAMTFTFFDASGNQVGAAISTDFTSQFKAFYQGDTAGSSFLMRVSFPIAGLQTQVATVQAMLTNSAGQALTSTLTFQ
jgi:hypothetical protein